MCAFVTSYLLSRFFVVCFVASVRFYLWITFGFESPHVKRAEITALLSGYFCMCRTINIVRRQKLRTGAKLHPPPACYSNHIGT